MPQIKSIQLISFLTLSLTAACGAENTSMETSTLVRGEGVRCPECRAEVKDLVAGLAEVRVFGAERLSPTEADRVKIACSTANLAWSAHYHPNNPLNSGAVEVQRPTQAAATTTCELWIEGASDADGIITVPTQVKPD